MARSATEEASQESVSSLKATGKPHKPVKLNRKATFRLAEELIAEDRVIPPPTQADPNLVVVTKGDDEKISSTRAFIDQVSRCAVACLSLSVADF